MDCSNSKSIILYNTGIFFLILSFILGTTFAKNDLNLK